MATNNDIRNTDFLFSENPSPMWIYDPSDLSIRYANPSASELYGYSRQELESMTIADLRPESEIPKLKKEITRQVQSFHDAGVWKHRKKNGDLLYVRVLSHPISVDGASLELVSVHDVTGEVQYQQELRMLLENSLDSIMLTSPDGHIIRANQAACEMLGMTEEEIIRKGREGLVHPDDKLRKALEVREQTGAFAGELTFIHASGRKIPVEVSSSMYTNPQGKLRTSLVIRDITDRKQHQIELKKAYREKETILESIGDGFFTVDRNWMVTYWNRAAERLLETPKVDILGEHLWEVFSGATDQPSYTNYHRVMKDGAIVDFEDYYEPLNRWYDVSAYPSEEGISVYFKDITEQKRRQAQLHESLKEKETLLAEVHHRVKNNLAVVSGMMQLQAFDESDKKIKEKLHDSVGRIKTMALIHELLYQSESFSRLESDANIRKLVQEITKYYDPAIETDLRFDLQKVPLNINQAMPVCLIINEVVTNIFKHAYEEGNQGTIKVQTTTGKDDRFTLKIIDDGNGLPEDFPASVVSSSLGLQLIGTLAEQLDAEYNYQAVDGETSFTLAFKKTGVKGPAATGVL